MKETYKVWQTTPKAALDSCMILNPKSYRCEDLIEGQDSSRGRRWQPAGPNAEGWDLNVLNEIEDLLKPRQLSPAGNIAAQSAILLESGGGSHLIGRHFGGGACQKRQQGRLAHRREACAINSPLNLSIEVCSTSARDCIYPTHFCFLSLFGGVNCVGYTIQTLHVLPPSNTHI